MRNLNLIAAEILTVWRQLPPSENVIRFTLPYVEAMLDLRTCKDMYGVEDGDMIVARALDNMTHWRGVTARRIKVELNEHLKTFNDPVRTR